MLLNILLVFASGGFGCLARYLLSELLLSASRGSSFPINIFIINIFGSLLAGFVHFFIAENFDLFSKELRLTIVIGFLGGFTTFSAFSIDILRLFYAGQIWIGTLYIISSVIFSIFAVFLGFYLSKIIFG